MDLPRFRGHSTAHESAIGVSVMANRAPKRANRRPRRQYTDGFKTETVRLVRESGKPISAVAREMDLTESVLRKWVNGAERATGRRGPLSSLERDELEQLRREVRTLRTEQAILKKARSEEHTSELQSLAYLVCRLLLEKK